MEMINIAMGSSFDISVSIYFISNNIMALVVDVFNYNN